MYTTSELNTVTTETSYDFAIFGKLHGTENWRQFGGWYISPKKAAAAYKNTPYPTNWNEFDAIQIMKRKIDTTMTPNESQDLNSFGIEFNK